MAKRIVETFSCSGHIGHFRVYYQINLQGITSNRINQKDLSNCPMCPHAVGSTRQSNLVHRLISWL
jgi:hypothetical protein